MPFSAQHEEQSIRRCITNLCSNFDADLVNALLDDDQLLTDFQNDCGSVLSPIVKTFRQLHAQLKEELRCVFSGQISKETFPFCLLSILERQQQNKQSSSADNLLVKKEGKFIFKPPNSNRKEIISDEEKILSECSKSIEVINSKEKKEKGKGQQTKNYAVATRKNLLELQFINAFSLGCERNCELVDRSVQVESDFDVGTSSHANLKEKSLVKMGKEDDSLIETVSAASIYNGKESSFSTTVNSTNSTEKSVGEVGKGKVVQLLATRHHIKLYSVNSEGAFLSAGKRESEKYPKMAGTLPAQGKKEWREKCHQFSECSSNASRPFSSTANDDSGGATSNNSAAGDFEKRLIAAPTANGRKHLQADEDQDQLVEILSAKMFTKDRDDRQRSLATVQSIFNTEATQMKALIEERGEKEEKGQKSKSGQIKRQNEGEEEEEQSTLNQVTPIPTTLELSNSV